MPLRRKVASAAVDVDYGVTVHPITAGTHCFRPACSRRVDARAVCGDGGGAAGRRANDRGATADVEVGVAGLKERLLHTLFWLTVKNGKVVLAQQPFLPGASAPGRSPRRRRWRGAGPAGRAASVGGGYRACSA
jgi:hypothetical protein